MRNLTLSTVLLTAATLMTTGAKTHASDQAGNRAAMLQVVQELGISRFDMIRCVKKSGVKRGQKMTEAERAATRPIMFACLRRANPDLTDDKLRDAFAKLPERR